VSCFLVIKTRRVSMLVLIEVVFARVALAAYTGLGVALGFGS
jgi:hypothetical protein